MASGGNYEGHDLLDEFLLNQVTKYVRYRKLNTFARDLGIRQEDYERITAPNTFTQDEQIHKVCYKVNIAYWIFFEITPDHFSEIQCIRNYIFEVHRIGKKSQCSLYINTQK